jgi:hypothetical protein
MRPGLEEDAIWTEHDLPCIDQERLAVGPRLSTGIPMLAYRSVEIVEERSW